MLPPAVNPSPNPPAGPTPDGSDPNATGPRRGGTGGSPWSFRLATLFGIPVRIHFTFLLFLAWIAFVGQARGDLSWVVFLLALFACVLLHEFGHALTARRYGVQTRDITLYPIGGVALLDSRPRARHELWIALAGPAVNVVIALALLPVVLSQNGGRFPIPSLELTGRSFPESLLIANLSLAIFNMIPAFPMDGGRVLRAALAYAMPEDRATQIAATVGQGLAIVLGLVGLFTGQVILMLIAFFVFLGAGQEMSATMTRTILVGHKVADAMQTRFRTIESGASLETAAQMLLAGSQQDFPVALGDQVVGLLTRNAIARGLATEGPNGYVAGHMLRDFATASPYLPLERVLDLFEGSEIAPILVMEEDRLLGMLTRENLGEFIMLQHARAQARSMGYAR